MTTPKQVRVKKAINVPKVEKKTVASEFEAKLFKFISEGEGAFQYKAFCDNYYRSNGKLIRKTGAACGRWSIGYGTISYWGEVITLEEGIKRRDNFIKARIHKVNYSCWNDNQKIAILDFMYQFGDSKYGINKYTANCDYGSVKQILYPYGKYLKGVTKRREKGYTLFNS